MHGRAGEEENLCSLPPQRERPQIFCPNLFLDWLSERCYITVSASSKICWAFFFFSSSKAIRVNPLSLVSLVPFCLLITFYAFYPDKRLFQDSVLKKNLTYARMISDMVNYLLWYVLIHSQGGCVEYWVHQRRKGPKRLSQVPAPLSGNPRLKKKVKKPRNLLRKRE